MVDFHTTQMRDFTSQQSDQVAQDVQRVQRDLQVVQTEKPEASKPDETPSEVVLSQAVSEMNSVAASVGNNLRFSISNSGEDQNLVVQVVDPNSGDVIREFPSEELLRLRELLQANLGVIFNREG